MSVQERTIGEKLRILRKEYQISLREVASDLYISLASISRNERDDGEITVARLQIYCDYYGLSLKDFFDNTYWDEERYK